MKKTILLFAILSILQSINVFAQVPTDSLVFYYSFQGNADDMTDNGINGSVNGASLTTDRFGNENSAYSFDGIDDYIKVNGNLDTSMVIHPASISFWVKTIRDSSQCIFYIRDTVGETDRIAGIYIGDHISGGLDNELIVANRNFSDTDYGNYGYTTEDRSELINSEWHHIVIVYNDTLTKIYLDNILVSTETYYGTNNGRYGVPGAKPEVTIGTRFHGSGFGAFFEGDLDDFRMYNKALTTNEISLLFNEENNVVIDNIPTTLDKELALFPNPAINHVNISSSTEISKVSVFEISGKLINSIENINNNTLQLNIEDYNSGLLLVRIETANHVVTKKLYKK